MEQSPAEFGPVISINQQKETAIRQRLDTLHEQSSTLMETDEVFAGCVTEVQGHTEVIGQTERLTLHSLARHHPEEIGGYLTGLDTCLADLNKLRQLVIGGRHSREEILALVDGLDASLLDIVFKRQEQPGSGRTVRPVDLLRSQVVSGRTQRARAIIDNLYQQLSDPQTAWEVFRVQGLIPDDVAGNLSLIHDFAVIERTYHAIEALDIPPQKKILLRAHFFHRFVSPDSGINLLIIDDIIHGRQQLDDQFTDTIIDALADIEEQLEDQNPDVAISSRSKRKLSKRQKIIIGVGVASATAVLAASRINPIQMHMPDFSGSGQTPVAEVMPTLEPEATPQTGHSWSDYFPFRKEQSEQKPEQKTESDFGLAEIARLAEVVVWNVQGPERVGYYRENTTSYFNDDYLEWESDVRIGRFFSPAKTNSPDITITGIHQAWIGNIDIAIPTKEGTYPRSVSASTETGGKPNYTDAGLYFSSDNTFTIIGHNQFDGNSNLRLNFVEHDDDFNTNYRPHLEGPSQEDLRPLVFPEDLPSGFKKGLDRLIADKTLTDQDRTVLFVSWLKDNSVYSAEDRWAVYYSRARSGSDYFARIAKARYGDCDIINGLAVAGLRYMGIPARGVIGYYNAADSSEKGDDSLTALERHFYIDAYYPSKNGALEWHLHDATPSAMDGATAEAYEKAGVSPDQIFADDMKKQDKPLDSLAEEIRYQLEKLRSDSSDLGEELGSLKGYMPPWQLFVPLGYGAAGYYIHRRRNQLRSGLRRSSRRHAQAIAGEGKSGKFESYRADYIRSMLEQHIGNLIFDVVQRGRRMEQRTKGPATLIRQIDRDVLGDSTLRQFLTQPLDPGVFLTLRRMGRQIDRIESARVRTGNAVASEQPSGSLTAMVSEITGIKPETTSRIIEFHNQRITRRPLRMLVADHVCMIIGDAIGDPDPNYSIYSLHDKINPKRLTFDQYFQQYMKRVYQRTRHEHRRLEKARRKQCRREKTEFIPTPPISLTDFAQRYQDSLARPLYVFWRESQGNITGNQ